MKPRFLSALCLASAFAMPSALAGEHCVLDGGVFFSCSLKNGTKQVELCDKLETDEADASYAYFTPGEAPDLVIESSYDELDVRPWNGVGMREWHTVTFHNGSYDYEVYVSHERGENAITSGGIAVSRNAMVISELSCDAGSVSDNLYNFIVQVEDTKAAKPQSD